MPTLGYQDDAQRWRFFNGLRFRARWRPAAPGQADVGVLARETPRAGGVSWGVLDSDTYFLMHIVLEHSRSTVLAPAGNLFVTLLTFLEIHESTL